MYTEPLLVGYFTSLGLILAIGAQNAFVLRCGLRRQHIFFVCLICALSDAFLIALGVLGIGEIVQSLPWLSTIALITGVLFVTVYGILRIRAYLRPEAVVHKTPAIPGLGQTVLITLAFTWLNPHVYVDILFLIGTISTQFDDTAQRVVFALSAAAASVSFFFALGYGARALAPIFHSPERWRYIEGSRQL